MPLNEYLASVAKDLSEAWDHRLPLFADLPLFGPDEKTANGKHCVERFFRCLRQYGMLAIPMTGPESVRGPGYAYLDAVAAIAQLDGRGAAVRLPIREFSDLAKLQVAIEDTSRVLGLKPSLMDLFLDVEPIVFLPQQYRSAQGLVSLLLEPLRIVMQAGFRNVVVCGSCIPENVDKRYNGRAMRVERIDLQAWKTLVEMFGDVVVKHGDSGVVFSLEQDVSGPARPPARIRFSTATEHVLWRALRKDYLSLAAQVVASGDFDEAGESWGSTELLQCARFGKGVAGPREWVARDTNLCIEVTVRAIESFLAESGRLSGLRFADTVPFAWNQALIA